MAVLRDSFLAQPVRFTVAPYSTSFTNTAGTLLVVQVEVADGATTAVSGITYGGTALVKAVSQNFNGTVADVELWYLVSPATGANTITVSTTGTINILYIDAVSYTGNDPKDPIRQSGSASGSGTTASVTLPGIRPGSATLDLVGTGSGVNGWGQGLVWVKNNGTTVSGDNVASQEGYTTGSQDAVMNYAITSDVWGIAAVEIQGPSDLEASTAVASDGLGVYGPFNALAGSMQTTAFQSNAFQESAGGGGAVVYNEAVAASTTATDLVGPALVVPVSVAGSATASEAAALLLAGAVTETASTTPSVLFGFLTQAVAASESDQSAASDAVASSFTVGGTQADSAAASDTLASGQNSAIASSDSAVALDAVNRALTIPVSVSESSTVSDALALSWTVSVSESTTASDSLTATVSSANAFAESTAAVAADTTAQAGAQGYSDSAGALDTALPGLLLAKTLAETATASDTVDSQFGTETNTLAESSTASVSDTTTQAGAQGDVESAAADVPLSAGQSFWVSLSESTSTTDTVLPGLQLSTSVNEAPQATDVALPGLQLPASVLESANAAEIVDGLLATGDRAIAETASALDALSTTQKLTAPNAESASPDVLLDIALSRPASGNTTFILICDD